MKTAPKTIPVHAYDSAVIEFCWRWSRLLYIHTYRELRARLYCMVGGQSTYKAFAGWRGWQLKMRRLRKAP